MVPEPQIALEPPTEGTSRPGLSAGALSGRAGKYGSALALTVLTVLLIGRGITEGGFRYNDCSRHAMDGVFVYDFFSDLPGSLEHPLEYALNYYAQYPALGIPLYYPPVFATVEAGFFAIFGVSVVTARLTVLAFGVVGVLMLYKLVARIAGQAAGLLSAAAFVAVPDMLYWSRQAMLEMPTAAMVVTATYFFYRYAELGRRKSAIWTGVFVVLAVMTKQPAAFIAPAFFVYLVLRRRWSAFRQWEFWVGAAIIAVVLVPYFYIALKMIHLFSRAKGFGASRLVDRTYVSIIKGWASIFSTPGLICILLSAAASAVVAWFRPKFRGVWLLGVMVVLFFMESICLTARGTRYPLLIVPIMVSIVPVFLAVVGVLKVWAVRALATVGVLVLAGYSFFTAMPPVMRGYDSATRAIIAANKGNRFILFDGFRDGDVVFYTRLHDPARRLYALRGGKMLYTFASHKQYSFQEFITTRDGLEKFMADYGIRALALEDKDLIGTDSGRMLREFLRDSSLFELKERYPISFPGTSFDGMHILVYTVRNPTPPTAETLRIPLPGLQRVVEVPLKGKGRPKVLSAPRSGT